MSGESLIIAGGTILALAGLLIWAWFTPLGWKDDSYDPWDQDHGP